MKIIRLTTPQLFVLAVLSRESNYLYSIHKELTELIPELNITIGAVREVVYKFEKLGLIRETSSPAEQPRYGPQRRMLVITQPGMDLARYYYRRIEASMFAQNN